jgi:Na+-driven multidrug efflux pump
VMLLPGCTVFAITNVLAGYFNGVGRPKLNLTASAIGLCCTLCLDILLIPKYGARGAAVASSLSYVTSTIVSIYLFRTISGIPLSELYRFSRADLELLKNALKRLRPRSLETEGA